jgi:(S)-2-hydroxyglutarate dehydrogenase
MFPWNRSRTVGLSFPIGAANVSDEQPMRIAIIGGGIVGLATAFRLGKTMPDASITTLEKEATVGQHQSGHNSGVLHCGLYYKPGSMKAKLAVTGIRQMIAFCQEHSIQHEVCGKLVIAAAVDEIPRLNDLYERGQQNGLSGLRKLRFAEMREIEPHVGGVAAVRVPEEGISDYPAVCKTLERCLMATGGKVITHASVTRLHRKGLSGSPRHPRENLHRTSSSIAPACIPIAFAHSRATSRNSR